MRIARLMLLQVLACIFVIARAAGLPDTGQTLCDNGSNVMVACTPANAGDNATYPRQDGRFGRDAAAMVGALVKTGRGAGGLDYVKVANNKTDLAPQAALGTNPTDWACTRDAVTELTWEVKTALPTDLRYFGHTYTWYNSTGVNDGGNPGTLGTNTCNGTLAAYANQCNTQNYVAAVNAVALCGYTDWRMPTSRELRTVVNFGAANPAIDTTFFPNTGAADFWTATPYMTDPTMSRTSNFADGSSSSIVRSSPLRLRVVRGANF